MKKTQTIPTVLGIMILLAVIVGLSFGRSQVTKLFSRASTPEVDPSTDLVPDQILTPTRSSATSNKFHTNKIEVSNVEPGLVPGNLSNSIDLVDGKVFDNSLPTFSGKVDGGQIIRIEIHSETPMSGTIRANSDGTWSWTPPANLSPGQHTVTLSIQLPSGEIQTVERSFYITSGTDILPITNSVYNAQTGTASAVPIITPIITPIPTPPLPTPILTIEPTPLPTPLPMPPPTTGSFGATLGAIVVGFVFLLGGLLISL